MCTPDLTCRMVELNSLSSLEEKNHPSVMKRISPVSDNILPLESTFKAGRQKEALYWRRLGWQVAGRMLREGRLKRAPGFPIIKTDVCRLPSAYFSITFHCTYPLDLNLGERWVRTKGFKLGSPLNPVVITIHRLSSSIRHPLYSHLLPRQSPAQDTPVRCLRIIKGLLFKAEQPCFGTGCLGNLSKGTSFMYNPM